MTRNAGPARGDIRNMNLSVTPRLFAKIMGGVALLVGLLALVLPISVDRSSGGQLSCGDGFKGLSEQAGYADAGREIADAMYPSAADDDVVSYEEQCADAIGIRRAWGWPVLALGGVVVVGAVFVQAPARRPADDE